MPSSECIARSFRVFLPLTVSVLAAGCSADVARFDFPASAGFADSQTNSIPIPPATVHSPPPRAALGAQGSEPLPPVTAGGYGQGAYAQDGNAQRGTGQGGYGQPSFGNPPTEVRVAELPRAASGETMPQGRSSSDSDTRGYETAPVRAYDAAPRRHTSTAHRAEQLGSAAPAGSESIEVKPGDTLYGLSRRHNVPVSELKTANDLKGNSLKPGQRLTIPAGRDGGARLAAHKSEATSDLPTAMPAPTMATTEPVANQSGTYTMKPGDSLYAIARKHNVKYAELQQHNGITDGDVRKIRPGTVLKIPGSPSPAPQAGAAAAASGTSQAAAPAAPQAPQSEPVTAAPVASGNATPANSPADGPKVLNPSSPPAPSSTAASEPVTTPPAAPAEPEKQVAAVDPAPAVADKAAPEKSSGKLRWPVQGKIITGYGPRADGTHNDGVNFSVPLGTEVHAAEDGEVIYVGDDLKAYGKLVLLRHDNGWVTAYAHNEDLMVKRGDKVTRGQVVAKAGKTGPVDQPQVHFELRQDSKAVDPTAFMEKL